MRREIRIAGFGGQGLGCPLEDSIRTAWSPGAELLLRRTFSTDLFMPVILHLADNAETVRGGLEYQYAGRYAVRSGYDLTSDEMGFSAGLGVVTHILDRQGSLDYAWTGAGHLGAVHRFSLGLGL